MSETPRAAQAWADYLAMGGGRSLEKLAEVYRGRAEAAPTRQLSRLKLWSQRYGWQSRLQELAAEEARAAAERIAAERRAVLEEGLALDHERVRVLKELGDVLLDDLRNPDRRWLRDVKQIGAGEDAERVDLERFNDAEVAQLRGILDDIAKEKGERVRRTELTGKGGGPVEVVMPWAQAVEQAWQQVEARRGGHADS